MCLGKLGNICRLCGSSGIVHGINVLGEEGEKLRLVEKITQWLPVVITQKDLYPKEVCPICILQLETLESCRQFVQTCSEVQASFSIAYAEDDTNRRVQKSLDRALYRNEKRSTQGKIVVQSSGRAAKSLPLVKPNRVASPVKKPEVSECMSVGASVKIHPRKRSLRQVLSVGPSSDESRKRKLSTTSESTKKRKAGLKSDPEAEQKKLKDVVHNYICNLSPVNLDSIRDKLEKLDGKGLYYTCPECCGELRSWSSFRKHVSDHKSEYQRKCKFCGKLCFNRTLMRKHMVAIHNYRPHQCCICGIAFADANELARHAARHPQNLKFDCHLCPNKYMTDKLLRRHLLAHEKRKKKLLCDACGAMFKSEKCRLKHMIEEHGTNSGIESDICGENLKSEKEKIDHVTKENGANSNFTCEVCNSGFSMLSGLAIHIQSHDNDEGNIPAVPPVKETNSKEDKTSRVSDKCSAEKTTQNKAESPVKPMRLRSLGKRNIEKVHVEGENVTSENKVVTVQSNTCINETDA